MSNSSFPVGLAYAVPPEWESMPKAPSDRSAKIDMLIMNSFRFLILFIFVGIAIVACFSCCCKAYARVANQGMVQQPIPLSGGCNTNQHCPGETRNNGYSAFTICADCGHSNTI